MSNSNFTKKLEHILKEYRTAIIDEICKDFEFDKSELTTFLDDRFGNFEFLSPKTAHAFEPIKEENNSIPKSEKKPSEIPGRLSPTSLAKATRPELAAYCKSRQLKTSGKKDDLLNRLLEYINREHEENGGAAKVSPLVSKPKAKTESKAKKENNILEKMKSATSETIKICRNQYGNYEHTKTGLILDKFDKKVIGKQSTDENGESVINPLTPEDINLCNLYKFEYELPVNLNKGNSLGNDELNGELDIQELSKLDEGGDDEDDEDDDLEEFYDEDN